MRIVRILVVLALLFAASGAHAQTPPPAKDVAKKLFEEGVELEKKNDFTGALAKYHEAESITVTAGLHFHLAFCLEQTNKLAAALDAYEVALKLAKDTNKADVQQAIAARLEPLRARVPFLAVKLVTQVNDAVVQLDGASLATVLLDGKPFRIDPGDHTIVARATGYAMVTKKVQVPQGATTNVEIALERDATPPSTQPQPSREVTEPPHDPAKQKSNVLPIALGGGAVVLLVTGVVSYVVAGNAQSDARTDCLTKTACDSPRKKVRTFDALALGGFVGAAGLGALAIITWTTSSSSGSTRTTRVVASPTSLGVEGTF